MGIAKAKFGRSCSLRYATKVQPSVNRNAQQDCRSERDYKYHWQILKCLMLLEIKSFTFAW